MVIATFQLCVSDENEQSNEFKILEEVIKKLDEEKKKQHPHKTSLTMAAQSV